MAKKERLLLILFVMLIFMLCGCGTKRNNSIVCGSESGLAQVLEKDTDGYNITFAKKGEMFRIYRENAGVELNDTQAKPFLYSGDIKYWYPMYLSTVVIAIDRDKCTDKISDWQDLENISVPVGVSGEKPDADFFFLSASWGLDNKTYSMKNVCRMYRKLKEKKLMTMKNEKDAPILVCFDSYAARLKKAGRNIEIVVPKSGTLIFERGIASNEEIKFGDSLKTDIIAAGLRTVDGECDTSLYPAAGEYINAQKVENYADFNTNAEKTTKKLRRDILGERKYTTADGHEHAMSGLMFIIAAILWSGSIVKRSVKQSMAKAALFNGVLLVGWIVLRLIKYAIYDVQTSTRYMWYGYYVAMLLLPTLLLWVADIIDKRNDTGVMPKWLYAVLCIDFALIALVFTNDLHQTVFIFEKDMPQESWQRVYRYGAGYFVLCSYVILKIFVSLGILFAKAKNSMHGETVILPLTATVLFLVYGIAYVMGVSFATNSDYVIMTGIYTLIFYELSVRTGFIPVNQKYEKLFINSPLKMQITDKNIKPVISANGAEILNDIEKKEILSGKSPIPQSENKLVYADSITGGYVVWQEDITELNELYEKIEASVKRLEAANRLLEKTEKIRGDLIASEEKKKLFASLEREIKEKYNEMRKALKELPDKPSKKEIARIALMACYIKRRCNLFFIEKEAENIQSDEFEVYVDELSDFADYAGIKCSTSCAFEGKIKIRQATLFYDFLYVVISMNIDKETQFMVEQLEKHGEKTIMKLLVSNKLKPDFSCTFKEAAVAAAGAISYKNLDEAGSLWLSFAGECDEDA